VLAPKPRLWHDCQKTKQYSKCYNPPMPAPEKATLKPGTLLGERFLIRSFLGAGAMGEVYAAEDQELGAQVAVKLLRPALAQDEERVRRFKREIQLARQVTHPNVCRLFDLFHHRQQDGKELSFVTMELLEGETLARRLKHLRRLEPSAVQPLLLDLTAALTAAHSAGVVHRDLKTDNILLVPDASEARGERAVITDFGLARALPGEGKRDSLTEDGQILGSPAYMAPEQLLDEEITPRTDLYSLGIVLFEVLTGRLPFEADTAVATAMLRLDRAPPSPQQLCADLDPHWDNTILRCLERDPAQRFASAAEVAATLGEDSRPTRRLPPRGRPAGAFHPGRTVGLLMVLAGVLGLNAWLPGRVLPPDAPPREIRVFPTVPTAPHGYDGWADGTEALYRQGVEALSRLRPEDARKPLHEAWSIQPANPWIRLALVQTLIDLEEPAEVRPLLEMATAEVEILPQTVRRALEARRLELDAQPAAAVLIWGELHHLFPAEPAFLFNQAQAALDARQAESSLSLLMRLKLRHLDADDDPRVWAVMADAFYLADEPTASLCAVRLALRTLQGPLGQGRGGQRRLAALSYRLGELHHDRGRMGAAMSAYRRAAETAVIAGNRRGEATALYALAVTLRETGALDEATSTLREVVRSFQQLEAEEEERRARWLLAFLLKDQRQWTPARKLLEELRLEAHDAGDRQSEMQALRTLADVLVEMGDTAAARRMYTEIAVFCEEASSRSCLAKIRRAQARLERAVGDLEKAARLAHLSLAAAREIGRKIDEAAALAELGRIAELADEPAKALDYHREVLSIYRDAPFVLGIAQQLTFIGKIETGQGNFNAAEEALTEALALRREAGPPPALQDVENALEELVQAQAQAKAHDNVTPP
jgi:tetratricopeptide (TPR) repeat protein